MQGVHFLLIMSYRHDLCIDFTVYPRPSFSYENDLVAIYFTCVLVLTLESTNP